MVKRWTLLVWVTQFGWSALFPVCAFLLLGSWLQSTWKLGVWVMIVCGAVGLLTSACTARSCIRAMRRDADGAASDQQMPIAFNEHD